MPTPARDNPNNGQNTGVPQPPAGPAPIVDEHDPRLEIPEILRKPVEHPALNRPKPKMESLGLGELGAALAMGIDFLATTAAGGAIGWGIDHWRNSSPYGLLVGVLVGFGFATVRIIQRSNAADKAAAERKKRGG